MNILEHFNQWIDAGMIKIGIKIDPTDSAALAKQQYEFLIDCIEDNLRSKIYNDLKLTQKVLYDRQGDNKSSADVVQTMVAFLGINRYQDIVSYIEEGGMTREEPLYIGRTSGTSDGNTGGKNIPITATSLEIGEKYAMRNTLLQVIKKT